MDDFDNLSIEELLKKANDAYAAGDYETAVKIYTELAEKGNVTAQRRLAQCYASGTGVKKNTQKLLYWLIEATKNGDSGTKDKRATDVNDPVASDRISAEQGDADAQFNLFNCYFGGKGVKKDISQAIYWLRKAAENGHAKAQCKLGFYYSFGIFVKQNSEKAVYWYAKAAEQDDADAQFFLGECFEKGNGVVKDLGQAVYWYTKAAEQGQNDAQFCLGNCYFFCKGVERNPEKAVYWWTKAAEQGNSGAQYNLGVCYKDGTGVEQDLVKAVYWFKKAAEQGHKNALYTLALCYDIGIVGDKNPKEAFDWYTKAAEKGHKDAQFNLFECYLLGKGVKKDTEKTLYWLTKAAEQGHSKAQLFLGVCYKDGTGVEKDPDKALYWFEKAYAAGYENAKDYIDRIKNEQAQLILTEKKDVFISWNKDDVPIMKKTEIVLSEEFGMSVWQSDKLCTNNIIKKCESAIQNSSAWVILITKNALESTYIPKEIEWIFDTIKDDKELTECIIPVYEKGVNTKLKELIRADSEKYASYKKIIDLGRVYDINDTEKLAVLIKNALCRRKMIEYRRKVKENNRFFNAFVSSRITNNDALTKIGFCTKYEVDGEMCIDRSVTDHTGKKLGEAQFIDRICKPEENNVRLLVGEGGTGKSLYLSALVRKYFSANRFIFITSCKNLVDFYNKNGRQIDSLEQFFLNDVNKKVGYGFDVSPDVFYGILNNPENRIIFMLDAIDELGGERKSLTALKELIDGSPISCKRNVSILLTSRNISDRVFFGIAAENVFTLDKFTLEDGKKLAHGILNRLNEQNKSDVDTKYRDIGAFLSPESRKFDENELFVEFDKLSEDIISNPLLITNFIVIFIDHVLRGTAMPKNRFEIADKSILFMLHDVETERDPLCKVNSEILKRLNDILCDLALQRALGDTSPTKDIFERYIRDNLKEFGQTAEYEAEALRNYLKNRAIIKNDDENGNVYHAIFQAYLIAKALYKKCYEISKDDFDEQFIDFRKYPEKQFKISGKDFLIRHNEKNFVKDCDPWVDVVPFIISKLDGDAYHLPGISDYGIDKSSGSYDTMEQTLDILYPTDESKKMLSYAMLMDIINARGIYNERAVKEMLGLK